MSFFFVFFVCLVFLVFLFFLFFLFSCFFWFSWFPLHGSDFLYFRWSTKKNKKIKKSDSCLLSSLLWVPLHESELVGPMSPAQSLLGPSPWV